MDDRTNLKKYLLKTDLDKDTLQAFIRGTIGALARKMDSSAIAIVMLGMLEGELANLRRIAESKKKGKESYGQDSFLYKIIYGKDGSKTFVPLGGYDTAYIEKIEAIDEEKILNEH